MSLLFRVQKRFEFCDFLRHEAPEVIHRHLALVGRNRRQFGETLAHGLARHRLPRDGIQPGDDRLRRSGRREQRIPALHLKLRQARFRRGWNIGQGRQPRARRDGEPFRLAVENRRGNRRRRVADAIDLPADQIGQRRSRAAIADEDHIDLGGMNEALADQVIRRADAGMTERHLARILAGVIDKGRQRRNRQGFLDREHAEALGDDGDRHESVRLERQARIDGVGGRIRAAVADHQGVAIRRRMGHPRQRG